ncbi:MAG TPA: SprT family zinc-dependent metalloprotease [Advenella sp.]|nr:SprT family zinc-dependent metalloprotease [Advenella sp.]
MTTQSELFHTPAPSVPDGARLRTVATMQGLITFTLARSRRRSIGFVIGSEGLRVTAPYWVSLKQIDEAVLEKAEWIRKKLAFWRQRNETAEQAQQSWLACTQLPYLGTTISINIDAGARQARFDGDHSHPQVQDTLWLALPPDASAEQRRSAAAHWLQTQAQRHFELRIHTLANNAGLQFQAWRLSRARGRWGSCNSSGSIRLNWRLIHFTPDIIDYVIAHELAHLKQMNHSARFWQQVGIILPGYEAAMQKLKTTDMSTLPVLQA